MQYKHRVFKWIRPWSKVYRVLKVLSIIQLLITIALPLVWSEMETGIWWLSFVLFAFWLSNYALIRMAHYYEEDRKGVRGWIIGLWENLLFLVYLLVFFVLLLLCFKLFMFHLNP